MAEKLSIKKKGRKKLTVLYKTLKNSNISNYVKDRVINDNLEYLLSNGVQKLLNDLTIPLDSEEIIIWGDGSIEISVYSDIFKDHENYFKRSDHERDSLKGINKDSTYYKENKVIFKNIQSKVQELLRPMDRSLAYDFFGYKENEDSGSIRCNAVRLHFINEEAYVEVEDKELIPNSTISMLTEVEIKEIEETNYV